ncbi:sensor histidine kinase [Pontibacillus litoralis]|uniref:histidine kinase n=1 Tax=Pontibacillus litoralis JSM 072002 TaxID=1385512 RepID=A0A0A5G352_9BACI|nr:ATP-binding protein [Pontibacillus litoralis]KGX87526.1 histidine kinase [Pontibacillus litoralis JSM 072002]
MGSWLQIRIDHFTSTRGIREKIWVTLTIVSFLTIVTGFGLTFYLYEKFYVENQKEQLLQQGEDLVAEYYTSHGGDSFYTRLYWTNENSIAEVVYIENAEDLQSGVTIQDEKYDTIINEEERQKLLNNESVVSVHRFPSFESNMLAVLLPIFHQEQLSSVVLLYMPLQDVYEPFESLRLILFGALMLLILCIIWIGKELTDRLIDPLLQMKNISHKMAQGDFTQRIHVYSYDEVGALSESFNQLAYSLEMVDEQRREFLQNVSHELRTPLSYIRGYTEAILDGVVKDEEEEKRYIAIIHREVDRLNRLVNDLLDLAQLEGDSYPMKAEPIPFAQLVHDVVNRFQLRAKQQYITIKQEVDEGAIVNGDSDRLEQVVSNVLDNALRYSDSSDTITLRVVQEGYNVLFSIEDTGCGIPEADVAKIAERFYRVDKARTRKHGGVGLGLAIVQQIVEKHNGTIKIESELGIGTKIIVTLPAFL